MACAPQNRIAGAVLTGTAEVTFNSQKYLLTPLRNHTPVMCSFSRLACNGHKTTDNPSQRLSKHNTVQTLAITSTLYKRTKMG